MITVSEVESLSATLLQLPMLQTGWSSLLIVILITLALFSEEVYKTPTDFLKKLNWPTKSDSLIIPHGDILTY